MAIIEYMNIVLGMNHAKFDSGLSGASKKLQSFGLDVKTFGKNIGAIATGGGMIGLAKTSVQLAADAETAGVAFEVLTGSAEKAQKILADMRRLDRESPLGMTDFQAAAKTMIGFGVSSEDAAKRLEQLSAVSMGNAERFQTLSLAFSQTTAAGRLMGQEVLQFVNSGFNPLQQISKMTGESMAELKARMEAGGISIREVEAAFDAATSKGGMFFGMNEKIANTAAGQYAKLQGDLRLIGIEFGNSIIPSLKSSVELTRNLIQEGGILNNTFIAFGDGLETVAASLRALTGDLSGFESMEDRIATRDARIKAESFRHKPTEDEQKRIDKRMAEIKAMRDAEAKRHAEIKKDSDEYNERVQLTEKNLKKLERELELEKRKELSIEKQLEAKAKEMTLQGDWSKQLAALKEMEDLKTRKRNEERAQQILDEEKDPGIERLVEAANLMTKGLLTKAQFDRMLMKEANSREIDVAERRDTPTAMEGSVEAYKLFIQRDQERSKEIEIANKQNENLEAIKNELRNRGVLGVAKR
jgi:tape measure domain-containing protein